MLKMRSGANKVPEVLQAVKELEEQVRAKQGGSSTVIFSSGAGSANSGTATTTVTPASDMAASGACRTAVRCLSVAR